MNEAFEKILEKLEELRETYDEMAFIEMNTNGHTLDFEYAKGKKDVMLDVKKIVQEVAEEYKDKYVSKDEVVYMLDSIEMCGDETWMDYYRKALKGLCKLTDKEYNSGWIPCSERMPEERGVYIVTEKVYSINDRKHTGCFNLMTEQVEFSNGKWIRASFYEVIAWMPLPEPFKAETEGAE